MKIYKIRDAKTGLYKNRKYGFSAVGATWSRRCDLTQHLKHKIIQPTWQVVEFILAEQTVNLSYASQWGKLK